MVEGLETMNYSNIKDQRCRSPTNQKLQMLSPWHENKYYINRRGEWMEGNKNKNVLCDHLKGNLSSFPEAFCLQTKKKKHAGRSDVRTLSGHMAVGAQTLTIAQPVTSQLQDSLSPSFHQATLWSSNTHTHTHTHTHTQTWLAIGPQGWAGQEGNHSL